MDDFGLVTAVDAQLMQGLAQRVTAVRPDLVNSDASFGGSVVSAKATLPDRMLIASWTR